MKRYLIFGALGPLIGGFLLLIATTVMSGYWTQTNLSEVAKLFVEAGHLVLATFISPTVADRARVRSIVGERDFLELHVSTPLEVCEKRDPKGLYSRARSGEVTQFTGVSAPWEPPAVPDLDLPAHELAVEQSISRIQALLVDRGIVLGALLPGGGGI